MASLRIDEAAGTGQFPAAVWRSDKANTFSAWSSRALAWELSVPAAFRDHEARYVDAHADRLTIHCTVDVLQHNSAVATRDCFVSVPPPPSISGDLHKLLRGNCLPDVTFIVEGTEIPAHKLVLAMRSSVFRAQFFYGETEDMKKERSTRRLEIKIADMTVSTFRAMLYFIYTDEQPRPKKQACLVAMAQDLLVAADLYGLERLRLMCEKILSENMDVDNVMMTLIQIHGRHSCWQLEACCIEFLASNPDVYGAVEATEEYKELEKDCAAFINEVTKKVARRAVARNSSPPSSSLQPHKSVSRYNPNALVRGRHDFVIENLNAVRQTRHATDDRDKEHIRSGTFQVGVYGWAIDVYPWKKADDGKEHIGIYLTLMNAPAAEHVNVEATACFRINDPSPTFSHRGRDPSSVYTRVGHSYGHAHFATLESAATSHDGSLTVHGEVQVTSESRTSTAGAYVGAAIIVPPTELAWHLEQLLASQQGSDVKFLVEQCEIHAHRLVIAARSLALHKVVVESARNMAEDHVIINGMSSIVFKAMLHFIYTDELPPHLDSLVLSRDFVTVTGDLLGAACRFRLERMKRLCINLLAEKVNTVSNTLATLKVARCHNCPELEEYCRRYMALPHVANKVTETCISLYLDSQLV
ncbi:BTB/POZ and MATH domain-containing protein 2-like [Lolium rigidum]|uniref:BTB/POZ and MATH domain-containing protein 2-like n=1 Tax=Lolium rigidum TaxID=89674 RepID=UPI001F5DC7B8|nr:BTB/POZ and MATH domain-containing protein 2-like [Lolium rigidum]